jgi:outer membrane lipoprotein-sorting protein
MKIFSRLRLAIISITLFFSLLVVSEAEAQVLPSILNKMQTHQKSLYSFRSKITMEKYNSQLKESDVNAGIIIYLRGGKNQIFSRIDWTKPVQESLSLINREYVLYRPRLKQALMGTTYKTKENYKFIDALSFLNMSKNEIKAYYDIKYLGQETVKSGTKTWHLVFTPKTASIYKAAQLWVDGNGMPIQAKVVEHNDDSTTVLLSDWKKNATIDAAEFKIKLPISTKIIRASARNLPTDTIKPNKAKPVKRIRKSKRVKKITIRRKRFTSRQIKNAH